MAPAARALLALLFVLLAGAQVLIAALVASSSGGSSLAARFAPSHPDVLGSRLMAEVGEAAAAGGALPESSRRRLGQLARTAPLSAEPFLVEGALAVRNGDYAKAERLLVHARSLAPRSPAARYLLADLYLRSGRALPAMAEMAILNRLLPTASASLGPALAAYAATPGTLGQVRSIIGTYPELEPWLLTELAKEPRNADLVMRLATPRPATGAPIEWQQRLFAHLIEEGQYAKAHALWQRISGLKAVQPGLFNPRFADSPAPPPFNWEFPRITGGVVERRSGGLQILYFGRDNLVFAQQVLVLRPGPYRLSMALSGDLDKARSIRWVLSCIGGGPQLLDLPLGASGSRASKSAAFTVPTGACGAQRLELRAEGQEFPERSDIRIEALELRSASR